MALLATAALILAGPAISISDAKASQGGICEREIAAAATKYGVPEGILYSVGLTETGKRGSLQPWALNVEGKAIFADSRDDALQGVRGRP
jgi:hypothetical protein